MVSEELNIGLLWIDSLCIVQDDDDDKASEITSMPLIYSQATVTIAASRARNVQEGFLQDRPLMGLETADTVFELPFQDSSGNYEIGSVILLPPTDEVIEPLDHRGWSMQERFLSRRILEYGTHQTRWTCHEYMNSNAPADGFKSTRVYNNKRSDYLFIRGLEVVMTEADANRALDPVKFEAHLRFWHHLLRVYTDRSLSLSTDRLPGVSGIAALFAEVLQDTYYAGLWKSRLATELLWTRSSSSGSKLAMRPTEYQGPSWSWAGINGSVQEMILPKSEAADNDFKVIDCQIHIRGRAPQPLKGHFGAVDSAKLIISGRLQTAELRRETSSLEPVEIQFPRTLSGKLKGILAARVTLDCIQQGPATSSGNPAEVFLLKVIAGPDNARGLVLRRTQQGEYSRIGTFTLGFGYAAGFESESLDTSRKRYDRDFAWLGRGDLQTITII
ncbi:hypothetical protein D0Z07_1959 [Hyphodiscus hymeniophilus]|uniref:Heterokaryon incompatibility domain-containing protein n=1 Tax=Hyphodiscus hymeniophilus TaxID=353542 RepID=A0A9P7AZS9_9HELO|nr:hypothetical protein D0Z07_1959 [Hyphodiscus hymeniophilus]